MFHIHNTDVLKMTGWSVRILNYEVFKNMDESEAVFVLALHTWASAWFLTVWHCLSYHFLYLFHCHPQQKKLQLHSSSSHLLLVILPSPSTIQSKYGNPFLPARDTLAKTQKSTTDHFHSQINICSGATPCFFHKWADWLQVLALIELFFDQSNIVNIV